MSKPIVFYDMASSLDTSLSISWNTIKTKFNFLYKRIPFETVWVPLADVQRVSTEAGIPQPAGRGKHTVPAIVDPATGTRLADSLKIAHYLDERHPDRPLFPPGTEARQVAFIDALTATAGMDDALAVGFAGTYRLLDKPSQAIFDERLPAMGVDLSAIERMSTEEKRARVAVGLDGLAAAVDAQGGQGGHVVGDSITFADLAVAAFVEFFRMSTGESEYILTLNGGRWKRLLDEIRT